MKAYLMVVPCRAVIPASHTASGRHDEDESMDVKPIKYVVGSDGKENKDFVHVMILS